MLTTVSKPERIWFGLLLAIAVLLALIGLDRYPRLSFDEGYYLQLARNLAQHGEYALTSPPGAEDWFGLGNSSPTLVLPIALAFKLFGAGVAAGRLIPALYLMGALLAVYALVRHLYGWRAAVLGAALFLTTGPLIDFNTVMLGRRVLGEVPGLFFVCLGTWVWLRAWQSDRARGLLGAGVLFGLAFVTKEQFMPLVVPAMILVWLVDRVYYRQLTARHLLVPLLVSLVPVGAWYGAKLAVLGMDNFMRHLATLSDVSRASTWLFEPSRWPGHIGFLNSQHFWFVGLPGVLYALALSARRDRDGLKSLFLPVLAAAFLTWFVFFSIGWPRYAYTGLALSGLLAGKPLSDLTSGLLSRLRTLGESARQGEWARPIVAAIVALAVIGYPLQDLARQVALESDRTPQEFAAYLEQQVGAEALVESFVWEIDFLTARRFHHPPSDVFARLLREQPPGDYDPLAHAPQYLVDGPYSKGAQLYPASWLEQCCRMIGSVGGYDLYRVVETARAP